MIFIFPKNYNFHSKFLGILDYFSLFLNILWQVFIFCLINLIFDSITLKLSIFAVCCFPLLILSIVGINNENIFFTIFYLLKFFISYKLYLFNKT